VLEAATKMLGAWLGEQLPELDRQEIHDAVDTLVRLTVSHIVLPAGGPEETASRLVRVALRYLWLEAPAPSS
jgi:hypothetical protein